MQEAEPRLQELDALRGIAASGVVLFHLTKRYFEDYGRPRGALPAFPFEGMQGVFLFFILSGFVISLTLERNRGGRAFVLSRFSRIYPAYWVSVALTFSVVHALGLPGRETSASEALFNLSMLQAFFGVRQVDHVYWSLAAELAFYAIAFALHARGWLWTRPQRIAWVWLGYCAAFALLERALGLKLPEVIAWLTLARFAPLFIAGMLFYRLYTGRGSAQTHAAIAAAFVLHNLLHWQGKLQFPLTVAAFAAFYAIAYGKLGFIARRPLLLLGAISYPLYLVHDNVGMALIRALVSAGARYDVALGCALLVVLLCAWLISFGVERPALRVLRARRAQADSRSSFDSMRRSGTSQINATHT